MIRVTNEPDLEEYELPFNWKKQCKRRKSGNTWDVYITHGSSGKRFRSNVAINDYLTNNPEVKCNLELTNCKYTYQVTLPTAEIITGKNAREWVSIVSYLKKKNENIEIK